MFKICVNCGQDSLREASGTFSFNVPENAGGGAVEISDASWLECQNCGERILSPELQKKLEKRRYQLFELLSPDEIREIRKRVGLTQKEIAAILSVGDKTYTRWETGRSIQSKSSDTLIRLFSMNPDQFMEVRAQRKPNRNIQIADYCKAIPEVKGLNELGIAAYGEIAGVDPEAVLEIRKKIREAAGE